jgi:hypothetical protein
MFGGYAFDVLFRIRIRSILILKKAKVLICVLTFAYICPKFYQNNTSFTNQLSLGMCTLSIIHYPLSIIHYPHVKK